MKWGGALLIAFAFILIIPARSWDDHSDLTYLTVLGLEDKQPLIWKKLNQPITVSPIETFAQKAFGKNCTLEALKEKVLEGIGKDYKVYYVDGVIYRFRVEWDTGTSIAFIQPKFSKQQEIGGVTTPLHILRIYSEEPDWMLDDDVARLEGKGFSKETKGTATRVLRHFWYEGESFRGIDLGKDQETDRRMELFYQLAMVAFTMDEPYWGYRFLGNALHYLQDMSQPFHIKALINTEMFRIVRIAAAVVASKKSLSKEIVHNGWAVSAYHVVYEGLGKALLERARFSSKNLYHPDASIKAFLMLTGRSIWKRGEKLAEKELNWDRLPNGLLNLRQIVRSAQKNILPLAEEVGHSVFQTFGTQYRDDPIQTKKQIVLTGTEFTAGNVLGRSHDLDGYREPFEVSKDYETLMIDRTLVLLSKAARWGRMFLTKALLDADKRAEIEKLQAQFAGKCSANTVEY